MRSARARQVVLVVGEESLARARVARELGERGYLVLLCGGPGDAAELCALMRVGRCVVVEAADAVVILPYAPTFEAAAALGVCAQGVGRVVLAGTAVLEAPPGAVAVESVDPSAIADAVAGVLNGAGAPAGSGASP